MGIPESLIRYSTGIEDADFDTFASLVMRGERWDLSGTVRTEDGGSCMSCHSNKDEFCDRCHDYLAVKPYCWECHVEPKGDQ